MKFIIGKTSIATQQNDKEVVMKKSIEMTSMLSCAALIAALFMPGLALAQNPAAIAVRTDGEADVVIEGPNNSLLYYHATPGSKWDVDTIAGDGTTFSAPAIAVRKADPAGEADVVAEGPNNSLLYYHAKPGTTCVAATVAGDGTTFSAPAIAVRTADPTGEADVVAEGPNNSLLYYHAKPGKPFVADTIAGDGTTFSTPVIAVRKADPAGEADVVAYGPDDNSLLYYHATPASKWDVDTIAKF